jgi:hypothetical protein
MVAILEELDPQLRAALDGDQQARSRGQANVQRLRALMNAAGGRKLLERWSDDALTDFNADVSNAMVHYEAFYMVRILEDPNPFAAKSREAAQGEANLAAKRSAEARSLYRRLK